MSRLSTVGAIYVWTLESLESRKKYAAAFASPIFIWFPIQAVENKSGILRE